MADIYYRLIFNFFINISYIFNTLYLYAVFIQDRLEEINSSIRGIDIPCPELELNQVMCMPGADDSHCHGNGNKTLQKVRRFWCIRCNHVYMSLRFINLPDLFSEKNTYVTVRLCNTHYPPIPSL